MGAKWNWNDQATLGIPCPECGQKTEVLLNKLIDKKALVCGGCQKRIAITGNALSEIEGLKKVMRGSE
jgi:transcription elongation factor Elf1